MFTKKNITLTLAIALSLPLFSACAPTEAQPQATKIQKGGVWTPYNSAQAFGLKINGQTLRGIFHSDSPPEGAGTSATGWWLRSTSTDYYAPISAMTYGGQNITELSTVDGWLQVSTPASEGFITVNTSTALYLTIGAPLNKVLRITHSSSEATYGKYTTEWSDVTGSAWTSACPHPYIDANNQQTNLTEYMIPVGNALWSLDGSQSNPEQTIQLSCTHDSIGGCITWGYLPWDSSQGGAHQACTRMKRGDFCGTGDPATTINASAFEHTQIQVWDRFAIHEAPLQTANTMEAFWDERGATCLNRDLYRSDNKTARSRMEITVAANCPELPTCSVDSDGLLGSARHVVSSGGGSGGSTL